ncbi:hypothetical protein BLNAU_4422 [Blattamonas nauphoetae]|uniref:Uncharacterized protein n=1 Tax=Blattamonas nauphoetae TaxID=2049346 RepID=A0ABQ9YA02_9EUKA|nr:hypothetical protein BLNAU_22887 [Blattamonas nauphoetae]KAK2960524.1 hypothetical protein BLNAU_4422 [Blattamonas nauphoetae]
MTKTDRDSFQCRSLPSGVSGHCVEPAGLCASACAALPNLDWFEEAVPDLTVYVVHQFGVAAPLSGRHERIAAFITLPFSPPPNHLHMHSTNTRSAHSTCSTIRSDAQTTSLESLSLVGTHPDDSQTGPGSVRQHTTASVLRRVHSVLAGASGEREEIEGGVGGDTECERNRTQTTGGAYWLSHQRLSSKPGFIHDGEHTPYSLLPETPLSPTSIHSEVNELIASEEDGKNTGKEQGVAEDATRIDRIEASTAHLEEEITSPHSPHPDLYVSLRCQVRVLARLGKMPDSSQHSLIQKQ